MPRRRPGDRRGAGARAPRRPTLVSNELVSRMKPGSVLVDISIDQGGCFEDSRPTTHADPTYRVHDSVFYCVANMPGAVPHTSTYALTNVTLPYALELANQGWREALRARPGAGAGPQHPRRPGHLRAGRRGARHGAPAVGGGPGLTASPDDPPQPSPALRRVLRTYLDHLTVERGLSGNTLSSYRRDLDRYLVDAGRRRASTSWPRSRRRDVAGHLRRCARATRAAAAVGGVRGRARRRAVRGLHRFAVREGLVGRRRRRGTSGRRRCPAGCPRRWTSTEVERLLDASAGDGGPLAAARPGAARVPLRHRGADLRGGRRARSTTSTSTDGSVAAARQGRQDPDGADRRVRPRRRWTRTWCGRGRPLRRGRPGHAGGVPQRPRRSRCRGRARGRSCARPRAGPGCRSTGRARSRRTRCATRSPPTCSTAGPTCGWCRSCSGTRR